MLELVIIIVILIILIFYGRKWLESVGWSDHATACYLVARRKLGKPQSLSRRSGGCGVWKVDFLPVEDQVLMVRDEKIPYSYRGEVEILNVPGLKVGARTKEVIVKKINDTPHSNYYGTTLRVRAATWEELEKNIRDSYGISQGYMPA